MNSSCQRPINPLVNARGIGFTPRNGRELMATTRMMSCKLGSRSMLIARITRARRPTRPGSNGIPSRRLQVSSPAIHPGDLIYVQVWNTSATAALAYFYNYSTEETATYQLTAPNGATLKGNSIEWIVERPSLGPSLARLTNYIDVSWPWNIAWNYRASTPTYHYPGDLSIAAPFTLELITMLGNGGYAISYGSPQNLGFLYFEDTAGAHGTELIAPYN